MAEKKVTYLCVVRLLLDSTTALEGLFEVVFSEKAFQRSGRIQQQSDYAEVSNLLFTYI